MKEPTLQEKFNARMKNRVKSKKRYMKSTYLDYDEKLLKKIRRVQERSRNAE